MKSRVKLAIILFTDHPHSFIWNSKICYLYKKIMGNSMKSRTDVSWFVLVLCFISN